MLKVLLSKGEKWCSAGEGSGIKGHHIWINLLKQIRKMLDMTQERCKKWCRIWRNFLEEAKGEKTLKIKENTSFRVKVGYTGCTQYTGTDEGGWYQVVIMYGTSLLMLLLFKEWCCIYVNYEQREESRCWRFQEERIQWKIIYFSSWGRKGMIREAILKLPLEDSFRPPRAFTWV